MSSIQIGDLPCNRELDSRAMSAVRGGSSWGPNVNVNVNLDQRIGQYQNVQLNVLNNNGIIGSGFTAPRLSVSPMQWAMNSAFVPGL